ncbi:hypothetical protein ACJ73_04608 [Blastomyces percursus]|uniref:Transcription activator GCR1-like domain-containing protein n=1 Tax=Blastomyces percursus TaxID=1658174 RepID=A0A1J9Q663_9EURO|nr:hypothetical protein ACJ73_04608 [Blastomyces percursus]
MLSPPSLSPLGGVVQDPVEPGPGPGTESSSGPAGMTAVLLNPPLERHSYTLSRTIQSVPDLWREWTTGLGGGPSVQSLDDQGGSWRKGSFKKQMIFCWRKIIIDEIRTRESSVQQCYIYLDDSGTVPAFLHRTEVTEVAESMKQSSRVSRPRSSPGPLSHPLHRQLNPFAHSPQSRAVLALPGQDVVFVRGAITEVQVRSHRQSYVNALLIQSRGQPEPHACTACRGGRPFPECRRVPGHFGGACGNCKWRDHAARCSVRDGGIEVIDLDDDDDEGGSQRQIGGPWVAAAHSWFNTCCL